MTDKPTDFLLISKLYEVCGVEYFNDDLKCFIKQAIRELYHSNLELILKLRLNHIDRAILKYRQANYNTKIWNTKQYFKACLLSAITETKLDELDPID